MRVLELVVARKGCISWVSRCHVHTVVFFENTQPKVACHFIKREQESIFTRHNQTTWPSPSLQKTEKTKSTRFFPLPVLALSQSSTGPGLSTPG